MSRDVQPLPRKTRTPARAQQNCALEMVEGKKRTIFAVLNHEAGRGPARLRRLVWDQEIAGSNPAAPTTKAAHICGRFFCGRERKLACTRTANKNNRKPAQQAAAFVESLPNQDLEPEHSERRKVLPPRLHKTAHISGRFFCGRERKLASQRRIADHGLSNRSRPIHRSRTQRTKSLGNGFVDLAVKIVVILLVAQCQLPMVNGLVLHAPKLGPRHAAQEKILTHTVTFHHHVPLRKTNMVLKVDSEPHR